MLLKYSVGLDMASDKADACICTIDDSQNVKVKSTQKITNTKAGFTKLDQWIQKWTKEDIPVTICIEATGVYHEKLAYFLNDLGYRVSIVLPNKAKKYLQALGLKSKNDKIDAKGLARMGAEQNLELWTKPNEVYLKLRSLTRHHQSIQESITAERNKLHAEENSALPSKEVIRYIKKHIQFLTKQKIEVVKRIEEATTCDEEIAAKMKKVCKVKGLGILTVATVVAETNGFEIFYNYKQVVSYAGYDVIENQSGSYRGKTKISKRGNSRIRRILFMPSLTAKGVEGTVFNNLYERVYDRTGIKMKGVVAVQKKLLLTIYYLWKTDKEYQPNYFQNIQEEEQVPSSPNVLLENNKSSQTKDLTTQGKHPVNDHSMLPLLV